MSKDSLFGGLPPPVTSQPLPPRSATGAGRGEAASSIPSILSSSAASKRSVADDDSHGRVFEAGLALGSEVFWFDHCE